MDRLSLFPASRPANRRNRYRIIQRDVTRNAKYSRILSSLLQKGDTVGIDGKMFSADEVQHLQRELRQSGIHVKSIADPMQLLWSDRPAMPLAPAFVYDTKYAGKSFTEKLSAVRKK